MLFPGRNGNILRARSIRWMRVVLKSLIVPSNRWKRNIHTRRNCFIFIRDQMFFVNSFLLVMMKRLYGDKEKRFQNAKTGFNLSIAFRCYGI